MEIKSILDHKEYSETNFTKRIIFKNGESTVFILNFSPGQKLPAHKHPGTEVYLLVLNGSGSFTINGKDTPATENDVVHVSGDEDLAFENTGDHPASLYVMLNKIPDERYAKNI
jgi:quercetin dioxygenase-like cupin family protein